MARRITIPYHLSAGAGAEGDVTLYTVQGARKFTSRIFMVLFPAGTYGELKIHLRHGVKKVMPEVGDYVGDNCLFEDDMQEVWYSGTKVIMHYKNENTTEVRECFVWLRGELE